MKDVPDVDGDKEDKIQSLAVLFGQDKVCTYTLWSLSTMYGVIILFLSDSLLHVALHVGCLCWLNFEWRRISSTSALEDVLFNYHKILWPLFYFQFLAYPLPIAFQLVHVDWLAHELGLCILGACTTFFIPRLYVLFKSRRVVIPVEVSSEVACLLLAIKTGVGVDLHDVHSTLALPGKFGERAVICLLVGKALNAPMDKVMLIAKAAELQYTGLWLHAKWVGKSEDKKTKMAVLGGDWFLAKAVVSTAEVEDSEVARSVANAIHDFVVARDKEAVLPRVLDAIGYIAGLGAGNGLRELGELLAVGDVSSVDTVLVKDSEYKRALVRFCSKRRL